MSVQDIYDKLGASVRGVMKKYGSFKVKECTNDKITMETKILIATSEALRNEVYLPPPPLRKLNFEKFKS